MGPEKDLLENMDKIHTTAMGMERIRRNLGLGDTEPVEYCKQKIVAGNGRLYRQGKNWYCETDGVRITANAHSFTIITAHRMKQDF